MSGRPSLRVRATLLATLATALVLVVTGGALLLGLRAELTEGVLDGAEVRTADLAGLAEQGRLPDPVPADPDETVVQVVAADGGLLTASAGTRGAPLDLPRLAPGEHRVLRLGQVPGAQGRDGYWVVAQGVLTPQGPATVSVASSLEDVAETVSTTTRFLLLAVPALVLVLSAGTWVLVGRTLAPVVAMAERAAGIQVQDLRQRLPEPTSRDEIGELARSLNSMLTRLEDGVDRQRRFVADAAHELRTPLAVLQAQLETGGSRAELLTEITRLQALADELLLLARLGQDAVVRRRPLDLDEVVDAVVARTPGREGVRIGTSRVEPAQVDGDAELLGRVVGNLLGNALRHADRQVEVSVEARDASVRLLVEDDGPGVPVADRVLVWQAFTRLDDARVRACGGAGLGLAIVHDAARAHGGSVRMADSPLGGALVELVLPRSSA